MRDILRHEIPNNLNKPFGGKTIFFGCGFRQILPVVPKGKSQDIMYASINSSYLWKDCKFLHLTKNVRLQNMEISDQVDQLKAFSEWMMSIGDGTAGVDRDGVADVDIPDDLLITSCDDPIKSIIESMFPSFLGDVLDASYLQGRVILAPKLNDVEAVNDYMISLNKNEERTYLSADTICRTEGDVSLLEGIHSIEFFNSIHCSGMPNHKLMLKVGVPVMLLRNIDHTQGLCNGKRLVSTRLRDHILEAEILSGSNAGFRLFILKISLTPLDIKLQVKFMRRQFQL